MFRIQLFKIRAFTAGVLASFLAALSRGGLMFMLIIWLQGIWLPLHGYDFARTPLWAGLAMLPLTAGFLIAGPLSGILSDRFGARPFATGGMIGTAVAFVLLELLPVNFPYWLFAVAAVLHRAGDGLVRVAEPGGGDEQPARRAPGGRVGDEHHVPELGPGAVDRDLLHPDDRRAVFVAAAEPVPGAGRARGVAAAAALRVSHLPPVSTLFAAFLGYNPVQHLVGPGVLSHLTAAQQATLTGRSFFPTLITAPFKAGLRATFDFAIVASLVAAAVSWTRGGKVDAAAAAGGPAVGGGADERLVAVAVDASVPPVDAEDAPDADGSDSANSGRSLAGAEARKDPEGVG